MPLQKLQSSLVHVKLFVFACLLPLSAMAAPLESLWTIPSGSLGAGRVILSISTMTVGTDGSVAFIVTTHDGSFDNEEYRLYWISADQTDLADDGVAGNEWQTTPMQPLIARQDQLVYLSGQQVRSLTRDSAGVLTDTAVGAPLSIYSTLSFMVEQSRHPSAFYLAEVLQNGLTFNLHAYGVNPVNNPEILVPTQVGIDNGFLTIVFATQPDAMYQIQASDNLINWTNFQSVLVGTGAPAIFSEEITGTTKQFYRVRKL